MCLNEGSELFARWLLRPCVVGPDLLVVTALLDAVSSTLEQSLVKFGGRVAATRSVVR